MTGEQWERLIAVINGNIVKPIPAGFIIDSPWLPGWAGCTTIDYFTSEQAWFDANVRAIETFPDAIFLPGFWAEFGMCTEPSAFGAKCRWQRNAPPFAERIITDIAQVDSLAGPDPGKDGMLPFVLNRLAHFKPKIESRGHAIKFAVSRGPLNICSFLMGTTEFLMAIRTGPDQTRKLLNIVTDFIIDWLKLQKETFASIDGLLVLDDIVGFLGKDDFQNCALPYLKRIFDSLETTVKFFHNDADGCVCAPYLPQIGVNLFNFSHNHTLSGMRELTEGRVTLLGNIPPRDVLAAGSAEQVFSAVKAAVEPLADRTQIILSCGGGMPDGVTTENIRAFLSAVSRV